MQHIKDEKNYNINNNLMNTTQEKKIILIVEDEALLSEMYEQGFLKDGGFSVFTTTTAEHGIELTKREKPDLVLLDIVLPKKDGFEILEELRSQDLTKQTPVILLTNLGQKPDVERGIKLGADDYIIKAHFTPSEVVEKINKILAS